MKVSGEDILPCRGDGGGLGGGVEGNDGAVVEAGAFAEGDWCCSG